MARLMAQKLTKAKPSLEFRPSPVHPGKADIHDPAPSPVPMAERRARIAEGHARRNAPVQVLKPRGSCQAVNAETGRQCALLGGHTGVHRHGRTDFTRTAELGQTSFRRRELLDHAAMSSTPAGDLYDRKSWATEKRESRERIAANSSPPPQPASGETP